MIGLYVASTDPGVSRVNMRQGPGTHYQIVLQIPNGTMVRAGPGNTRGDNGALWYKVNYKGKTGYVLAELLSLKKTPTTSTRSKPSLTFPCAVTISSFSCTLTGNGFAPGEQVQVVYTLETADPSQNVHVQTFTRAAHVDSAGTFTRSAFYYTDDPGRTPLRITASAKGHTGDAASITAKL
jgi:uncharacterized protein YraI